MKGLGLRTTYFVEATQDLQAHTDVETIKQQTNGLPIDTNPHHIQPRNCTHAGKHLKVSWTGPSFSSHGASLICDQMPIASS